MRKAIFILFSVLLMVSMLAIPADTISAKPASSSQLSAPSLAQQLSEEEQIDEILDELDEARDLTDNDKIKDEIKAIKKAIKKDLPELEEAGNKKGAVNLKYAIAERLELLINELPSTSPGMTTAVAAIPTANPLYEVLLEIYGKIITLIELEEREIPEEKPPPPPTIERPPEIEKLIVYSAKFLCGPAFDWEGVQPGTYSTAINIHNPYNETVYLYKKAVIAKREDEPRGRISAFRKVALRPDEAIEVDCIDIKRLLVPLQPQQTQTLLQTGAVSVLEINRLIHFIKGFVVIYSTAPLDVVAVYTASTKFGFSLDVESISQSRVGVRPIPIPTEEAECPRECECRTRAEAAELGLVLCQGQEIVCEYDEKQTPTKFCFQKPTEQVECPPRCECRTRAEAAELGLVLCQGQEIVCEYDEKQTPTKFCFQKPTEQAGPARITLTPTQARNKVCTYHKVVATVYDEAGNRLAGQKVYFHVDGANTGAGSPPGEAFEATTDANGQAVFSYHGKNEGEDKITAMAGTTGPVTGASKTWYTEAIEQPRPGRIGIDPVQDRNPVGTRHTITVTVYDTNGKPMPNTRVKINHTGAHSFNPTELTTDTNGKAGYYYTGKNAGVDTIVATVNNLSARATKTWYSEVKPGKMTLTPSQDTNEPGERHTVTATVWGTDGKPMSGVVVTFVVSGTNNTGDKATTNASGQASFAYTSKKAGKDTITATADGLRATAIKEWVFRLK